jgi:nicotinamidase-related amidase
LSSSALLVINVQRNRFEGAHAAWDGVELLARLCGSVARARAAGVPVIFVRNCGGPGDPDEPGTWGWELSPALPRLAGEPIVDKRSANAFVGTRLDSLLRARGVRRVIVCGVQTGFCVQATCRGAGERRYKVTLVEDGNSTFDSYEVATEVIMTQNVELPSIVRLESLANLSETKS